MSKMQSRWLLIAFVLAVLGGMYSLAMRNGSPSFTIDRSRPFCLEFGRGSGWQGLNTAKLDQTGRVVLYRMRREHVSVVHWETTTLQLSPQAFADVLNAVESNDLMTLREEYYENIQDGTQWVLWIKQGEREKSVYFNNNFPRRIMAFAEEFDAILARSGSDKSVWQPEPRQDSREHERTLWDSIKR